MPFSCTVIATLSYFQQTLTGMINFFIVIMPTKPPSIRKNGIKRHVGKLFAFSVITFIQFFGEHYAA
jgi:hypothetical protein